MIYVAEILDRKYIKVGFTDNQDVEKRMAMLQTGCPFKINCILVTDGTLIQEKELHKTLGDAFTRMQVPMPPNEWYPGRHPVMSEFIGSMRYGVNNAIAYIDRYNQMVKQPGLGETSLEAILRWPSDSDAFINKEERDKHFKAKAREKWRYAPA